MSLDCDCCWGCDYYSPLKEENKVEKQNEVEIRNPTAVIEKNVKVFQKEEKLNLIFNQGFVAIAYIMFFGISIFYICNNVNTFIEFVAYTVVSTLIVFCCFIIYEYVYRNTSEEYQPRKRKNVKQIRDFFCILTVTFLFHLIIQETAIWMSSAF